MNNHLSRHTFSLLSRARELREEGIYKFVWEDDGQILARVSVDSPATKIRSFEDLKNAAEGGRTRKGTRTRVGFHSDHNLMKCKMNIKMRRGYGESGGSSLRYLDKEDKIKYRNKLEEKMKSWEWEGKGLESMERELKEGIKEAAKECNREKKEEKEEKKRGAT